MSLGNFFQRTFVTEIRKILTLFEKVTGNLTNLDSVLL